MRAPSSICAQHHLRRSQSGNISGFCFFTHPICPCNRVWLDKNVWRKVVRSYQAGKKKRSLISSQVGWRGIQIYLSSHKLQPMSSPLFSQPEFVTLVSGPAEWGWGGKKGRKERKLQVSEKGLQCHTGFRETQRPLASHLCPVNVTQEIECSSERVSLLTTIEM